jgi:hypothetical protein
VYATCKRCSRTCLTGGGMPKRVPRKRECMPRKAPSQTEGHRAHTGREDRGTHRRSQEQELKGRGRNQGDDNNNNRRGVSRVCGQFRRPGGPQLSLQSHMEGPGRSRAPRQGGSRRRGVHCAVAGGRDVVDCCRPAARVALVIAPVLAGAPNKKVRTHAATKVAPHCKRIPRHRMQSAVRRGMPKRRCSRITGSGGLC